MSRSGRFRERVSRRQRVLDEARRQEEVERLYQQRVDRLSELDSILGDGSIEKAIRRRLQAYAEASEELEDLVIATPAGTLAAFAPEDELRLWREETIRDRRTNLLWQLYVEQLLKIHPAALELEEYSEIICARALLRLLSFTPRGGELLASLYDDREQPDWSLMRQAAIRAIAAGILDEPDEEQFLARLFFEVPGSRRAVYRLLGGYKDVIYLQAERDGRDPEDHDGELPGDSIRKLPVTVDYLARLLGVDEQMPHEEAMQLDLQLERAVASVARGKLSIRNAAKEYGVSRWKLQNTLKQRKIGTPPRKEANAVRDNPRSQISA